jgi:hypothetical protein
VVLVSTDVLENILPPSLGFLKVTGFHSCVTVASLLISFTKEGYYVGSKNAIFWVVFMVVSMIDFFCDFVLYAIS